MQEHKVVKGKTENKHISLNALFKTLLILLILDGLYFSSYFVIHNDIGYDTDIARDLLVMQNTVVTHKLPLIGPRTGGIDGLFHGPLWYYINLPAFIIGHGNPVAVGWFWFLLIICSVWVTYYIGKKIFNEYVGLLSALLLSFVSIQYSFVLLNPFGAVILSPLFFYFFYKYIESTKYSYLIITFLIIGLIIQFEVAFGGPILVLTILFLLVFLSKKKKLTHFSAAIILLVPFSTYILFDLRHNFLQLNAVLHHVGSPTGNGKEIFAQLVQNRINGITTTLLSTSSAPFWLTLASVVLFVYLWIISFKNKNVTHRQFYLLFGYYYIGYWPLSFYLNGNVLGFHVLPFLPVALLILSSSYLVIRKEVTAALYVCMFVAYILSAKNIIADFNSYSGHDAGSWRFNYELAQEVFKDTHSSFGYYVFTPDEWGYGPRYAISYVQKQYPQYVAYPNTKYPTTVIVLAPAIVQNTNDREWWIKNRVRITKDPSKTINFPNGYTIDKFTLTSAETKIPSDPNLVNGLFFR